MLNRFQDVFESLQEHEVRYLIIGGIAAVIHGVPRMTFGPDLLIEPTRDNASRLLAALEDAHLGTATLTTAEQLVDQEITIFNDRIRIDVQTKTPGIEFPDAWERRLEQTFRTARLQILSKEDLIRSKQASGRPIDLADIAALEGENI